MLTDAVLSAVIAATVSLLVTWRFGSWQASRAEAGRQDRAARTAAAQHLRALRARLIEEGAKRQAQQEGRTGPTTRRPAFTIYEFHDLVWPVVAALDNPVMNRRVANQATAILVDLLSQQEIDYLRLLTKAPGNPTTMGEVSDRIRDARLLERELNTPVDRMFQSDDPLTFSPSSRQSTR